jgi:hypothetical protein
VESILKELRANNTEKNILPSENAVIGNILDRSTEMMSVYEELNKKLNENQQMHLWDGLLGTATFWNPDVSRELRETKRDLKHLNSEIAKLAENLSELIQEREELCETSGISAYEDYHPLHWFHRAGDGNHLYKGYVKGDLERLHGQFDLKYWPESHEVVAAIGAFAEENEVYENNSWTEELLSSPKHSMADHLRVILKAIEEKKRSGPVHYQLPCDFRLSDSAIATIINCTLNLAPEDMLTSEGIKRSRQNIRKRKLDLQAT